MVKTIVEEIDPHGKVLSSRVHTVEEVHQSQQHEEWTEGAFWAQGCP